MMSRLKKRSVLGGVAASRGTRDTAAVGAAGVAVASAGNPRAGTPRMEARHATRMRIRERSRILRSPSDGIAARGLHLTRGMATDASGRDARSGQDDRPIVLTHGGPHPPGLLADHNAPHAVVLRPLEHQTPVGPLERGDGRAPCAV